MDHISLCNLFLLNTLIYCGHSQDKPKVVLSVSPQWMKPGDSVTLNCEVKESSTDWRFSWYKTVLYRAGLPSLLDKSYSVKPLSGNGTTEESYTLSPAGPTYTGGYVCRAGRADPVYFTDYSEPQFLWSGDLQPSWSLRISPNRTQHFSSKSLSLTCDLKGKSSGWRLMRYPEKTLKSGCSSNWGSITGSTCTITSTDTGDSGVYWCESGSGQYSNAVNITVSDGDVILESPAHLVTEGDSLTLRCKCRNQRSTNSKVDFYKDGVLIRQETTGEMTISAVMKSDEGFYKCKSDQRDSPESWVTVRVHGSSTSVWVIVGLVVCGVLLTILLLLLSLYKNGKGSCSNRIFWPIHPQSTNQDPQQDQGPTQVQCLDAGCKGDLMYAKIQHKTQDKKQKEKPADPSRNPVYSELKTETTLLPESESIYYQLKPFTSHGPGGACQGHTIS
ncbi:obscurin-like [Esox lucius]|uniref:Ig-like domain-containing protein n=1 Tax=Esox lucius TaxID=8010 RepID=A0AAY5KA11_ESOLU|nr:obscurin-like [Esox lucius]